MTAAILTLIAALVLPALIGVAVLDTYDLVRGRKHG